MARVLHPFRLPRGWISSASIWSGVRDWERVYLVLTNVTPYAEVNSGLDIQIIDEPEVRIGDASYRSLSLDMDKRSADGWLTRLAAAELGTKEDGLLDERRRALVANGRATALTRKEFDLMRYLAARQGEAVTRIELLNDVWGLKYDVGGNVADAVIAALRKVGRPGRGNRDYPRAWISL